MHVFTLCDVLFQLPGVKVSHFTDDYELKEVGNLSCITLGSVLNTLIMCCWKWKHIEHAEVYTYEV